MSALTATFVEIFGRPPEGLWSAPGRVNLIGEHTDYNDGLALPIALPQRTVAACARRKDEALRVHSVAAAETVSVALNEVGPGRPTGWAAYVAGVLWAMRADGLPVGGLDVVLDSDVPLGAGLSSSAALECSVAAAAADLYGLGLLADDDGRARLARAADRAENEIALAPTGGMDQLASLLCQPSHALLLDFQSGERTHVPFDLSGHGLALLVIDTRARHALVDGQYAQRRSSCEQAAATLGVGSLRASDLAAVESLEDVTLWRRARHVVTEIERVLDTVAALQAEDFGRVGELFLASHASLRDDYEVSCRELDLAVETACTSGALGARMTGGGFGGSAIALVPADRVEAVSTGVRRAFAEADLRTPHPFAVVASRGASRS